MNAVADMPLDTGIDPLDLTRLSSFWEATRQLYAPFESSMRSPSADVYLHEMPGGTLLSAAASGAGHETDAKCQEDLSNITGKTGMRLTL